MELMICQSQKIVADVPGYSGYTGIPFSLTTVKKPGEMVSVNENQSPGLTGSAEKLPAAFYTETFKASSAKFKVSDASLAH